MESEAVQTAAREPGQYPRQPPSASLRRAGRCRPNPHAGASPQVSWSEAASPPSAGDVRDAASLKDALVGATTVVSAMHGFAGVGDVSPASVDRDGNFHLIEAATSVGAAFMLVSVAGAA